MYIDMYIPTPIDMLYMVRFVDIYVQSGVVITRSNISHSDPTKDAPYHTLSSELLGVYCV